VCTRFRRVCRGRRSQVLFCLFDELLRACRVGLETPEPTQVFEVSPQRQRFGVIGLSVQGAVGVAEANLDPARR
jgi:hypothetical protein